MLKPSDWCRKQYDLACEEDRLEDAHNYGEMFLMWSKRGM